MDTPTPLKRAMYLSKARRRMTAGELEDMLAGARRRNEAAGVTGLLVYDAGHFAQVLEGPATTIDSLLASIAEDPRHEDYLLLSQGRVERRYFEGWSMDFANLERYGENDHRELRAYLRDHTIADRATIYRALLLFVEAQAQKRRG